MSRDPPTAKRNGNDREDDPFPAARDQLFPPLRSRVLTQASDALAQNHVKIAESLVSDFLRKKPQDPDALHLMARIAQRTGRLGDAEQFICRCLELSPGNAGYRFNYAAILRRLEKFEAALAQLDILLGEDPRNPLFRDLKAAVLRMLRQHTEALNYRRQMSEDFPRSPDVWLQYGRALRVTDSNDLCVAAFHKAIELDPSLVAAYANLASLKTYRFSAAEIEGMEQQLALPRLPASARADLHSALGKAYGDENQYGKSFENYAKGNALRRLGVDFDPSRFGAHRANCESLFTESFFRERTGVGCAARDPIFVVSMPRAGSTLVEQILSSHSCIEGLSEIPDMDLLVGRLLSGKGSRPAAHECWIDGWFEFRTGLVEMFPRVVPALTKDEFRALGEQYLQMTASRRVLGRPRFADKTLQNFGYAGLIHLILPNAKIVDVRRHPLDWGWSCFKTHFPDGQPFSERLSDIGSHYANYVRLMAHFDRVLPGKIHRVIYEQLVADPMTELKRLFDYLELPFEEQCLRFHENRRAVTTLSSEQVRAPLNQSGMDQWRPYEPWLGPLKSALGPILDLYPKAPE